MAALAPFGNAVDFVYTDLSPQLVAYGRKTYGATYGFAGFHVLDVERDPAPQVGSYSKCVTVSCNITCMFSEADICTHAGSYAIV